MKIMKYKILPILIYSFLFLSCSKENRDIRIPYPNDITFEDYKLEKFSYAIPNAPFQSGDAKSGVITFNVNKTTDGTYSGFAVSNKNWRSYPWQLSPDFNALIPTPVQIKASVDSCVFSVYTNRTNRTNNYLIANVKDGQAFMTLEKPSVVEHILVANTTYNYLLQTYGSIYSGTLDQETQAYSISGLKVKNNLNPNPSSSMFGRFHLPGPNGKDVIRLAGDEILAKRAVGKEAADAARLANKTTTEVKSDSTAAANALAKGYVKLTITGSKGGVRTSAVDYYLAIRPNVDEQYPSLNYIAQDWFKVDLSSLGIVDKVLFELSSSYQDEYGKMEIAPYFCLDGIRLKQ